MAAAFLRAELECFICMNIYTDPVMLICGHNFCRVCIGRVLDTQEESGGYSCPECRQKFPDRPPLHRNITLHNIVDKFLSAQPDQEESGVSGVHKNTPGHNLTDPTFPLERSKCTIHNNGLKYFCSKDDTCICESCYVLGEHQGHQVEMLDEAFEKKKETLRKVLQTLLAKREEMEERVQSLQEHRMKVEVKSAGDTKRVTTLFKDLRKCLEDPEKEFLRELLGQAKQVSISMLDKIRDLEIKKEELSRKMRDIEELCNMTDPLTVLQESDTGDLCDTEDGDNEDRERHEELLHDGGGLDVARILYAGLSNLITEAVEYFHNPEAADILLDLNTAHNNLHISDDRKTVSWSDMDQNRPETPERFTDYSQVMSSQSFSSGRHYWELEVGKTFCGSFGMCYPSVDRKGSNSLIGRNDKSWGAKIGIFDATFENNKKNIFYTGITKTRIRIYLDYEAGRISFYDLCDPSRHLHTFTTTFTEPLHAGVCVEQGFIKIYGGIPEM